MDPSGTGLGLPSGPRQLPKSGLPAPTREQVAAAERYARGSADYGATWACTLVNDMRRAAQQKAMV